MTEMSGVFAINKPSGITSAKFLSQVQDLFTKSPNFSHHLSKLQGEKVAEIQKHGGKASRRKLRSVLKVKMGHGGTLDPLASGVLVVGVNQGTKKLQNYLTGSIKTYETEALFGYSTTTGDVEGEILTKTGVAHITKSQIDEVPSKFIGELRQTPPIFAALKMNGKPLYEYARENIPLPQEIKSRICQIYSLEIFDDTLSKEHKYEKLSDTELIKELSKNPTLNENKLYYSKEYMDSIGGNAEDAINVDIRPLDDPPVEVLPLLHFKTQVSSGTYIRSLISDIGKSLGSSAYMVKLIRSQQAEWELGKNVFEWDDFKRKDEVWGKVLSEVFTKEGEVVLSELFSKAEEEFAVLENDAEIESNATEVKADGIVEEAKEGVTEKEVQEVQEPEAKKRKTE